MKKPKKEVKTLVTMRMSNSRIKQVDKLKKKLRFTRTKLIENAIDFFIENIDAQMEFLEKQKRGLRP